MICNATGLNHSERRRWACPIGPVARRMILHLARTTITQWDHQQVVFCIHYLAQFPVEFLHRLAIQSTSKYAVLNASSIRFHLFGDFAQAFGFAHIVTHKVPVLFTHIIATSIWRTIRDDLSILFPIDGVRVQPCARRRVIDLCADGHEFH